MGKHRRHARLFRPRRDRCYCCRSAPNAHGEISVQRTRCRACYPGGMPLWHEGDKCINSFVTRRLWIRDARRKYGRRCRLNERLRQRVRVILLLPHMCWRVLNIDDLTMSRHRQRSRLMRRNTLHTRTPGERLRPRLFRKGTFQRDRRVLCRHMRRLLLHWARRRVCDRRCWTFHAAARTDGRHRNPKTQPVLRRFGAAKDLGPTFFKCCAKTTLCMCLGECLGC